MEKVTTYCSISLSESYISRRFLIAIIQQIFHGIEFTRFNCYSNETGASLIKGTVDTNR